MGTALRLGLILLALVAGGCASMKCGGTLPTYRAAVDARDEKEQGR